MSFTVEEEILNILKSKKILLSAKKIQSLADNDGELTKMSVQAVARCLKKMHEDGKIGMVKISAGNRFCRIDLQNQLNLKANQSSIKYNMLDAITKAKEPLTISEICKTVKNETQIEIDEDSAIMMLDNLIQDNLVQVVSSQDENSDEILYGVKKTSKSLMSAKVEYQEKDGGYEVSYKGSKSAKAILFALIFGCSILLVGAIGFISSFLSFLINEVIFELMEGLGLTQTLASKDILTICLISSSAVSFILSVGSMAAIISIITSVKNCDASFWDDVSLTFNKACLYILPQFIIMLGLAIWLAPTIKTLFDTFSFSSLDAWQDTDFSAHIAGAVACIVSLFISCVSMLGCFVELRCPHCGAIGTVSYAHIKTTSDRSYKFDETKNLNEDAVRLNIYEVQTDKFYYVGTCRNCGGKKDRVETNKSKAKVN